MPAGPYLSCGRGASVEGENPIIEVLPKGFVLGLRMEMMFVQIFFWGGIRYSAIFFWGVATVAKMHFAIWDMEVIVSE